METRFRCKFLLKARFCFQKYVSITDKIQMLLALTHKLEICIQLHIRRRVLPPYKNLVDKVKVDYSTVGKSRCVACYNPPPVPQPSDQKAELDELLPAMLKIFQDTVICLSNCYIRNTSRHFLTAIGTPNSRNTSVI